MDSPSSPADPTSRRASQPGWQSTSVNDEAACGSSATDRQGFLSALDKASRSTLQEKSQGASNTTFRGGVAYRENPRSNVPSDASDSGVPELPDAHAFASEEPESEQQDAQPTEPSPSGGPASDGVNASQTEVSIESSEAIAGAAHAPAGASVSSGMPEMHLTMASSASLAGPASLESLSTLLRQSSGVSLTGEAMAFEVVGGEHAISALQLSPGAAGWNLRLAVERSAREALRRHAETLEATLSRAGHSVSRVQFVEGGLDE